MEIKPIDSLDISECLRLLKIDETSLKPDGLEYLDRLPGADADIVARLKKLLEEESEAFNRCMTISDYEDYLSAWPDGIYRTEAESRVADYVAAKAEADRFEQNAKSVKGLRLYLKLYPDGAYAKTARQMLAEKERNQRRMKTIVMTVIIVTVFILCVTNCHPVSRLSVSEDEVVIGKRGGTEMLTVSTDALKRNVRVWAVDDWIEETLSGSFLSICTGENIYDRRTGKVKIRAYATFFGLQYRMFEEEVTVIQESGLPTFLNVSENHIYFDKYGISKSLSSFSVNTDGCGLEITTDSDWIDMKKDIDEDEEKVTAKVSMKAGLNDGGAKYGKIMVKSGDKTKFVYLHQESGLATFFRVQRTSLVMSEDGSGEGKVYPVGVETDGTSWSVKSAPSWLTAYADMVDKRLEVTVPKNTGQIKKGTIILASNNGHTQSVDVEQQGDPTEFEAEETLLRFGTSRSYEYVSIINDSHKSLRASKDVSWITVTVINGNRIKLSCSANDYDPPRSGLVYVSCGGRSDEILVTQDGWTKCSNCGGDGYVNCPKSGYWVNQFGGWMYMWDNGRHILRHTYTSWASGIPVPAKEDSECSECGGDGQVRCGKCNGSGKIKKSFL